MSIPKIVHYCWFGPKDIPEVEKKCIASWSGLMPEYKIMLWNETCFDIESTVFTKQAYEHGKYAFVSDYVRMYALYHYGGIYLDADVEVIKSLESFMDNQVFIGFENRTTVGTGIIGAEKGAWIFKEMLNYYSRHSFVDKNGNIDTTSNAQIITDILAEKGFVRENREQIIEGVHVYERDYFCPKKINEDTFGISDRTATIHRFSTSWLTEREKKRGRNKLWRNFFRPCLKKIRTFLIKLIGEKRAKEMEAYIRKKMR